jgi:hypothetical protein
MPAIPCRGNRRRPQLSRCIKVQERLLEYRIPPSHRAFDAALCEP